MAQVGSEWIKGTRSVLKGDVHVSVIGATDNMIWEVASRKAVQVLFNTLSGGVTLVCLKPRSQFVLGFFLVELEGQDDLGKVSPGEGGVDHGVLAEGTLCRDIVAGGHGLCTAAGAGEGLYFCKIL